MDEDQPIQRASPPIATTNACRHQPASVVLAQRALDHLRQHRLEKYALSTHRVSFPPRMGFTAAQQYQAGDVFLRAVIAEALCDARDAGLCDPAVLLASECDYLVARRRRDGVGGWSYFPDLPELPSDIDDLSQVMQVLARCGRSEDLANFAEAPLSVVLRTNLRPDGAIRTWILPSTGATPAEERQSLFVRMAWGDDSDTEVIANFLHGLWVYDRTRFSQLIERGARFVRQQQDRRGAWHSTWYDGPYYGTYVCVRLLAEIGLDEPLDAARSFVLASQQVDGGWGSGDNSDQLSTAMTLCTLLTIAHQRGRHDDERSAERAIAMLCDTTANGRWDSPVFIHMNAGRARGKVGPWLTYGSSAVTAAYLLKAASACARC